jgi:hypothetical protein
MTAKPISFSQTFNDRVATATSAGDAVYCWGSLPKACVHPLTTPAGHRLTGFEMSDHMWHRGIWFTIKFVNGTNFWEEQAPFGVQKSVAEPTCEVLDRDRVRLLHHVQWGSEATGVVIDERRQLTFNAGTIDWSFELRAEKDLTLDRTPYTTWGGYGGLSYRAARELHDVNFLLPNGDTVASLAGQAHVWTVMQAAVDGAGAGQRVSIGMIDHPSNPRSPSPWYNKSGNGFNYMNAAFLFHEQMTIRRGESLKFNYRILYRDGQWTAGEFKKLANEFRAMKPSVT